MRVLVTGATGFVGSHAVAALRRAGHDVRVLARSPAKVPRVLGPLGIDPDSVEIAPGDIGDDEAVARAIHGCDAALHAAAQLDFPLGSLPYPDPDPNVTGARTVVGQAAQAGLDPVIYTSTISAYTPTEARILTAESPLAEAVTVYGRSKGAAEVLIREWQAEGAPVTTFVIGGVYGPISPHLDGSFSAVRSALETLMVVVDGGMGLIDVRDLASLLTAAVEPGRGPRRYMAGGRFIAWRRWVDDLSAAVGRELPVMEMEPEQIVEMGRGLDSQRAEGKEIDIPLSEDAALTLTTGAPTDDAPTLDELGGSYRPTVETFADKVRWMIAEGHLDPALAPAVAGGPRARQDGGESGSQARGTA